jgi:hypothetical protein
MASQGKDLCKVWTARKQQPKFVNYGHASLLCASMFFTQLCRSFAFMQRFMQNLAQFKNGQNLGIAILKGRLKGGQLVTILGWVRKSNQTQKFSSRLLVARFLGLESFSKLLENLLKRK